MHRADSLVWDPHKSLFLPYGTGLLLVRDEMALRAANEVDGPYLQDLDMADGPADIASLGPELTREFRALRVWLPLQLHGLGAIRSALEARLEWAAWLRAQLDDLPAIEVCPSDLTVVTFRHRLGEGATRSLLHHMHERERFFLSSTRVSGHYVGRVCVLSFRTTFEDVRELCGALAEAAAEAA